MSDPLRCCAIIVNERGLHARAAAKFVKLADSFNATVTVERNGTAVDGRSIMGLMMLAASLGTEIAIEAKGPDEDAAMKAMLALIEAKFGEE